MLLARLLLLAVAPEPGELDRAIWADLALNALIDNGNPLTAGAWYNGHDPDHPPQLHISDVTCRNLLGRRHCRFVMIRTPDPESAKPAEDAAENARLACGATLFRERRQGGSRAWTVMHYPSEGGGHSRTSLRCRMPAGR